MQEELTAAGKEVTGTIIIDETCHMLRTGRDLRSRKEQVDEADFLLVLSCGAKPSLCSGSASSRAVRRQNMASVSRIEAAPENQNTPSMPS